MQLFHDGGATSVTHDGETYTADADGRFEVPEEVGKILARVAGFHAYTGDSELSPEEQAEVEKSDLLGRIADLEAEVKRLKSTKAKAKPTASDS